MISLFGSKIMAKTVSTVYLYKPANRFSIRLLKWTAWVNRFTQMNQTQCPIRSKSRLSFSEVMNKLLFITFVCVCIYRYKLIIYGLFMLYSLHIWNRNIISFLYCKHKTHSSCICIFFNIILFFVRLECPPLSYSLTTNLSN